MEMGNFRIVIADYPDYERLVAEVQYNYMFWVLISWEEEDSKPVVRFYSHPTKKYWKFDYSEAMNAIEAAAKRLLSM